ncbi:MAG TPA: hypothetical protein VHD62_16370 [Opitutaceae bacterium]|nr:hypothetical protein [Opitutaceae bacterium]
MKRFRFLLAISLAGNLALVVLLARRPEIRARFFPPAPSANAIPSPAAPAAKEAAADPDAENWSALTAGDLPDLVARLRAGGIAPRFLRAIVGTLVREHFADRHRAIADALAAKPWWQGPLYYSISEDPKIAALRRQLTRDERTMMFQLLGPDVPSSTYEQLWAQSHYGALAPEKVEPLRQVNLDYDDLMAEVRAQAHGILLPEDREKLAYLEEQKRADIDKLLTPDELFDYNLRNGPTARRLRDQLAAFDPSEDEFRAIFKIHQEIEAPFADGRVQNLTQDERRARRDALASIGDRIAAVLPPDRLADYQLKTDPAYVQTDALVTQLALPPTATAQIVAVQKDATARVAALRGSQPLTRDQYNAQIAAISDEATAKLSAVLGPTGLAQYKQGSGAWLQNLRPIPAPPVAPKP